MRSLPEVGRLPEGQVCVKEVDFRKETGTSLELPRKESYLFLTLTLSSLHFYCISRRLEKDDPFHKGQAGNEVRRQSDCKFHKTKDTHIHVVQQPQGIWHLATSGHRTSMGIC